MADMFISGKWAAIDDGTNITGVEAGYEWFSTFIGFPYGDRSDSKVMAGRLNRGPASSGRTAFCSSGLILARRAPSMA